MIRSHASMSRYASAQHAPMPLEGTFLPCDELSNLRLLEGLYICSLCSSRVCMDRCYIIRTQTCFECQDFLEEEEHEDAMHAAQTNTGEHAAQNNTGKSEAYFKMQNRGKDGSHRIPTMGQKKLWILLFTCPPIMLNQDAKDSNLVELLEHMHLQNNKISASKYLFLEGEELVAFVNLLTLVFGASSDDDIKVRIAHIVEISDGYAKNSHTLKDLMGEIAWDLLTGIFFDR